MPKGGSKIGGGLIKVKVVAVVELRKIGAEVIGKMIRKPGKIAFLELTGYLPESRLTLPYWYDRFYQFMPKGNYR